MTDSKTIDDVIEAPARSEGVHAHIPSSGDEQAIGNKRQPLNDDVTRGLANRRSMHIERLAIDHESDLSPELRKSFADRRRRAAHVMGGGVDDSLEAAWRAGAIENGETVAEILRKRRARLEAMLKVGPNYSDLDVTPARPTDHSFWWASTKSHAGPGTQAAFRNDGLHFWGGPNVNDWDGDMHTSFGAVASFTLQPDRFPISPNGVFRSSPHMELFGGVVASAPDYDLLQGNGIAECKLFLRQTIFQFSFGQTGPEPRIIAEASGYNGWRIYLKNTGHSERQDMPGYTPIPEVTYSASQVAPNDLFVELEARLDIYLNCAGALVWCDPEVLMRTFQWEPTPLQ